MWGGSYFGYTQWVLADQVEPGPSALLIQISSTDFHGMFYPGGAFSFESGLYWALGDRGKQYKAPSQAMLQRGYDGLSLIEADDRAVKDVSFFNDWVSHRERDQYWAEIDGHDRAGTLEAPLYLMARWFDPFLPTQLEDFIETRRDARPNVAAASHLAVGPWAHARTLTFPTPRRLLQPCHALDQDFCATPEIRSDEAGPLRPPPWSPERGTILAKGLTVTSTSTCS